MTEPITTLTRPEVSFQNHRFVGYVYEAEIYETGLVILIEKDGTRHFYPPHRAPVVKD